jgi:hypothetical protein
MWNVGFKLSHPLSIRHASLALGIALMLVFGLMYEYPHLSMTVLGVFGSAVFFLVSQFSRRSARSCSSVVKSVRSHPDANLMTMVDR